MVELIYTVTHFGTSATKVFGPKCLGSKVSSVHTSTFRQRVISPYCKLDYHLKSILSTGDSHVPAGISNIRTKKMNVWQCTLTLAAR